MSEISDKRSGGRMLEADEVESAIRGLIADGAEKALASAPPEIVAMAEDDDEHISAYGVLLLRMRAMAHVVQVQNTLLFQLSDEKDLDSALECVHFMSALLQGAFLAGASLGVEWGVLEESGPK